MRGENTLQKRNLWVQILAVLMVVGLSGVALGADAQSQTSESNPYWVKALGFRAGSWRGDTVTATAKKGGLVFKDEMAATMSFGFFAETRINKYLSSGFSANIHSIDLSIGSNNLYDVALSLKGPLPGKNNRLFFRPGAGVGIGIMNEIKSFGGAQIIDKSLTFSARASGEFWMITGNKTAFVLDVTSFWTVLGGDNQYSLRTGPVFIVRLGLAFLK